MIRFLFGLYALICLPFCAYALLIINMYDGWTDGSPHLGSVPAWHWVIYWGTAAAIVCDGFFAIRPPRSYAGVIIGSAVQLGPVAFIILEACTFAEQPADSSAQLLAAVVLGGLLGPLLWMGLVVRIRTNNEVWTGLAVAIRTTIEEWRQRLAAFLTADDVYRNARARKKD